MRRSVRMGACALAFVLAGSAPQAGDRFGLGVKVGTMGFGLDLTARASDRFALRGSIGRADVTRSFSESGIDYDGTLEVGGYGVLVDFHPFKGGFRVTGGLFENRNRVEFESTPTSTITIGGNAYPPALVGTLRGDVSFRSLAPYAGIGFGNAARSPGRARFVFDLGLLAQGAGDATLSSSSGLVPPDDLRREEAEIEDEIGDLEVWPVIAVGISFRF